MNSRKIVKYALFYSVGIYAFQRLTGNRLGLPMFLDPLGSVLGYPAATPAVAALPAPGTTAVPAVVTAASPLATS